MMRITLLVLLALALCACSGAPVVPISVAPGSIAPQVGAASTAVTSIPPAAMVSAALDEPLAGSLSEEAAQVVPESAKGPEIATSAPSATPAELPSATPEPTLEPTVAPEPTPTPAVTPEVASTIAASGSDESGGGEAEASKRGEILFGRGQNGAPPCTGCHLVREGQVGFSLGPNLAGVSERAATRVEGLDVDAYLHQSILEPSAFLAPGYRGLMYPDYGKHYSETDLQDLIAFLKSL